MLCPRERYITVSVAGTKRTSEFRHEAFRHKQTKVRRKSSLALHADARKKLTPHALFQYDQGHSRHDSVFLPSMGHDTPSLSDISANRRSAPNDHGPLRTRTIQEPRQRVAQRSAHKLAKDPAEPDDHARAQITTNPTPSQSGYIVSGNTCADRSLLRGYSSMYEHRATSRTSPLQRQLVARPISRSMPNNPLLSIDARHATDEPVYNVMADMWTDVTRNNDFVSHLVSLYMAWMMPISCTTDPGILIEDIQSGNYESGLCSRFLVNVILARACMQSDRPEACAIYGDWTTAGSHFLAAAQRHYEAERQTPSLAILI